MKSIYISISRSVDSVPAQIAWIAVVICYCCEMLHNKRPQCKQFITPFMSHLWICVATGYLRFRLCLGNYLFCVLLILGPRMKGTKAWDKVFLLQIAGAQEAKLNHTVKIKSLLMAWLPNILSGQSKLLNHTQSQGTEICTPRPTLIHTVWVIVKSGGKVYGCTL